MTNEFPSIKKCPHCVGGVVALFTSRVRCEECLGTGFEVSDFALSRDVGELLRELPQIQAPVRTAKYLRKRGVTTLAGLVCFVAEGGLSGLSCADKSILVAIYQLLAACGALNGVEAKA